MIGLDTSVIIDLFKGKKEVKDALSMAKGPYASTQVNYAELMFGLDPRRVKPKSRALDWAPSSIRRGSSVEEGYYDELFSSISVLSLSEAASKRASRICWELKAAGREIEPFDCMVAGILIENGVSAIITGNRRHFERISGLKVISY